MSKFAQVGDFCPNTDCADQGKPQSERQQNIIRFGKTNFCRRRTPHDEIIETLALIAEGSRISSLTRVKGHNAADHAEAMEEVLLTEQQIEHGQLDGLGAYVRNRGKMDHPETDESGQFWRSTMIDMVSRLLVQQLKTLRVEVFDDLSRRWQPRTPVVVAGLTDHIWTVKELLRTVVPP